jgi:hypothetical protein
MRHHGGRTLGSHKRGGGSKWQWMSRPVAALSAVLLAAAISAPAAAADWQYARWGMTVEELIAASGGRVRSATGTPSQNAWRLTLATGTHSTEGMRFTLRFLFGAQSRRLECVVLELQDYSQLARLRRRLEEIYGSPSRHTHTPRLWRETVWDRDNQVTLMDMYTISGASLMHCTRQGGGGL